MDEATKTKMIEDIAEAAAYALAAYNKTDAASDEMKEVQKRNFLSEIMCHLMAARSFAERIN